MKALITSIAAVMLLTAVSPAEDKPPGPPPGGQGKPNPEDVFKKLDTNGDGSISLDEFKAGPRAPKDEAKAKEIYGKIDADGSGGISQEEFKAHRPPHGPGGPGGKEGRGGPGGGGQGGPGGGGPKGPPKGGPGGGQL